jgi:penicillin amidase
VVILLAGAVGALWLRSQLLASLPSLDGEIVLPGLSEPVVVERDDLGVPTLRAASRVDLARALGFTHAQERFFQMDLLRRLSAGELSEIMGSAGLDWDRSIRVHRFRDVARRAVGEPAPDVLQAYAEGVNRGLEALGAEPFEYLALRTEPAPWRPEDVVLVGLAMFVTLQDENGRRESSLGLIHDILPEPVFELLSARGTELDAPLIGPAFETPPLPGPEAFDLRTLDASGGETAADSKARDEAIVLGSNNWAVAGDHTLHGGALLANDMHLGLAVPNTWYRASFVWPGTDGEQRVTGITLPGTPAMIVGSNGHVAWGFTNTEGDWNDLIVLEPDPNDANRYLTPRGPRLYERREETIRVRGGDDEVVEVLSTIWGPVIDENHLGRRRALRWTAHDPEAVNFGMIRLEQARDVDEVIRIANGCGAPAQNIVAVDSTGRIGWSIFGRIPRRVGFDGRLPRSWADGSHYWDGWLEPDEYPRVIDPPAGRVWSANNRVVDGEMVSKIGDGGFALGARARQIRDRLLEMEEVTERDMLDLQLDDRALLLERWRGLLLAVLTAGAVAEDPRRAELLRLVEETWTGRADTDSVAFRMVRSFRLFLSENLVDAITAPCNEVDPRFTPRIPQREGILWKIVTERPSNLLPPPFESWDGFLLATVDEMLEYFLKDGDPLETKTWGQRNTVLVQHPLSLGVPFLGRWLDMPRLQLPGDNMMPRVQGVSAGASERLVVSPGREEDGIFHMPAGQSGHPLSPHYSDSHQAWARGEPTPFLPGPTVHTLTLIPE